MCQYEICGCEPVESGQRGPRVTTVIDRRVRPSVRIPGDRRGKGSAGTEETVIVLDRPVRAEAGEATQGRREAVASPA